MKHAKNIAVDDLKNTRENIVANRETDHFAFKSYKNLS